MEGEPQLKSTNSIDAMRTLTEQRQREGSAKIIPFLSFALTHMALTAFIAASLFVIEHNLKIFMIVLGVLLIASEWIYTIIISIKWRRDIVTRVQAEAHSRQAVEAARQTIKDAHVDMERNRWQAEITRRRWQRGARYVGTGQQIL
ncbi:MAG: hypothetical protein NVS2B12_06550 [Ktedonobacteraceae bacterium]